MSDHHYYVYILASRQNGYFYTGVTNDLVCRVYEHKEGLVEGYTKKHQVNRLVYYETYNDINQAIEREKLIKKWKRAFKIDAVERMNPKWDDLYDNITGSNNPATSAG